MFLSALVLLAACAIGLRAADTMSKAERDAEAKEMAEEDRTLRAETGKAPENSNFSGKFTAFTEAQIRSSGDATVIGRFDVGGDEPMLVRVMNDTVKADLKKQVGKDIVVNGRARLSGKYLYAARLVNVSTGNAFVPPPGGL